MSAFRSALIRPLVAVSLLIAVLLAPDALVAQSTARLPRVGVLVISNAAPNDTATAGLSQGLRELGYVDGRNVAFEWRDAGGRPERLAPLAVELSQAKVDVIVAGGPGPLAAVRAATSTIPIVAIASSDPVGGGWARSLARPGGNVTGFTVTFPELGSKRLELLKQALPGVVRVGIVLAPGELPGGESDQVARRLTADARSLGLQTQVFEVRAAADFERAVRDARDARVQALFTVETTFVVVNRDRLAALAAQHGLPVIGEFTAFGVEGVLVAYGANLNELWRRSATTVDRILKGTPVGDVPIEQPTKLELTVNLKAARALGIAIPQSLLLRADRVVE